MDFDGLLGDEPQVRPEALRGAARAEAVAASRATLRRCREMVRESQHPSRELTRRVLANQRELVRRTFILRVHRGQHLERQRPRAISGRAPRRRRVVARSRARSRGRRRSGRPRPDVARPRGFVPVRGERR